MALKRIVGSDRRQLSDQAAGLRRAGKTEPEIVGRRGLAEAAAHHLTAFYSLTDGAAGSPSWQRRGDQRPRLAYEMRRAGKSFGEISQELNVSLPRAHQIVHKYAWMLSRPKRVIPRTH
jgi:hypothetical protein